MVGDTGLEPVTLCNGAKDRGRLDQYRHYLGDSEGWGGTNRGDQVNVTTRSELVGKGRGGLTDVQ